jgi:hypothetical protein
MVGLVGGMRWVGYKKVHEWGSIIGVGLEHWHDKNLDYYF